MVLKVICTVRDSFTKESDNFLQTMSYMSTNGTTMYSQFTDYYTISKIKEDS